MKTDITPIRHNLSELYQSLECVNDSSYVGFTGGIPTTPFSVYANEANSSVGFTLANVGTLESGVYEVEAYAEVLYHTNGIDHVSKTVISMVEVVNTSMLKSVSFVIGSPIMVTHGQNYAAFKIVPLLPGSVYKAGVALDSVNAVPESTKQIIIAAGSLTTA